MGDREKREKIGNKENRKKLVIVIELNKNLYKKMIKVYN